jgi:hypothetical protein
MSNEPHRMCEPLGAAPQPRKIAGVTTLAWLPARLRVLALVAMFALAFDPAGALGYDTCSLGNHCYAVSAFDPGPILNSTYAQLVTLTDNVPSYTEDFANDEMWTSWNNQRWVELGDTTGESYGYFGEINAGPKTPYAFQASQTADGYLEYDYTDIQPGIGNWYSVRSAVNGVGPNEFTWYSYFDGIGPWGANGLTPSRLASEAEDGLEMTNSHITNHGESRFAEWQNWEGDWFEPWETGSIYGHREIADQHGSEPPTCAAPSAQGLEGTLAWYTARQSGSCWSPGYGPDLGLGASLGAQEGVLQGLQTPPPAVPLGANGDIVVPYTPASGPRLNASQLQTIATTYATHAGDSAPSEIQAVELPRNQALTAVDGVYPTNATGALASWLSAESDVIQLHGNFTLTDASCPPHASVPTGHVMTIVVDAHTGERIARALTETAPENLATLGAVKHL